jgi:DNA repair exonuclease SbcCD ATPase subunit
MEYRRLFDFLRARFDVADEPREAVLRATGAYRGKPYSLVYFDCTEHLLEPQFDLARYQQDLLATDYYSRSGSLQWNMYLYLLCEREAYERLLVSQTMQQIESDKVFARKFIRTPDDLIRQINEATTPSSGGQGAPERDLSVQWIDKLRDNGLDGVFMKREGYNRAVEAYLAGSPVTQREGNAGEQAEEASVDVSFVKTLSVKKQWRCFQPQPFQFGAVNLIQGPNGSGKTSLLEAIELCICGVSYRNQDQEEPEGTIEVLFEGQGSPQAYEPSNALLFRKRDGRWYKNYYMRGNNLFIGFNRFNFYDTDSGARLIRPGESDKSLQDAIAGLLIGETANMIQERAERFLDLFQGRKAAFEKLISEVSARTSQTEDELRRIAVPEVDQTPLRDAFMLQLRQSCWKTEVSSQSREALDLLSNDIDQVVLRLEACLAEVAWLREVSWGTLREERDKLAEARAHSNEMDEELETLHRSIGEIAAALEPLGQQHDLFRRLEPYIVDEEAFQLAGLGKRITDLEELLARLRDAWAFASTMDLSQYEDMAQVLTSYRDALAGQIDQVQTQHREVDLRIRTVQNATEQLRRLLSEIRAKANELVELQPDRTDCPVCRAQYVRGELARRLGEDQATEDLRSLTELLNTRTSMDALLSKLTTQHEDVSRITYALSLTGTHIESLTVRDAVGILKAIPAQIRESETSVASLHALRTRLETRRLIESELVVIVESFNAMGISIDLGLSHREELQAKKHGLEDQFLHLTRERTNYEEQLRGKESAKQALVRSTVPDLTDPVSAEAVIDQRYEQINRAVGLTDQVGAKMDLNRAETLDQILLQAKSVKLSCQNLARSVRSASDESRLNELRQRIQRDKDELSKLTQQHQLAQKACDVLNDILTVDNKDKYLAVFFEAHKLGILEIFTSIHAPKEFTDIEFQHEGQPGIRLVTAFGNAKRKLSQISTGQRSAFALSIFLALNGLLKTGPPLIFLDDPVAHVDDLNTLSFMDYLRRLVIQGERQVFFATANPKLANLFKRKFDFLGGANCQVIELPRRL